MRRLALAVIASIWISASFSPAAADLAGATEQDDNSATVDATANADTPPGITPKRAHVLNQCVIYANLEPLPLFHHLIDYVGDHARHLAPFPIAHPPEDTQYHLMGCPKPTSSVRDWSVWEVTEPPPPTAITAVARHAYNQTQVPLPTPHTSPRGDRDTPLIVNIQTWYWTDETLWRPVSVTADLPIFGISVTATATPTSSTWTPGDGNEPITCTHGTSWSAALGGNQASDCSHIYTTTTQNNGVSEPFALVASTTWNITYACLPVGYCPVPPNVPGTLTTNIERPIWVTEIKGLINN